MVKHIGFFPGSEIIGLNTFEARLGKLPPGIYKIRELIKRYEACHFKYRQHVERIKNSIRNLKPEVDPGKIGRNHIQHGEHAWTNDSTGRSLLGQQFVWAAKDWMDGIPQEEIPDKYDKSFGQQVQKWLGGKNADKIRLVRLLLARLTWDWNSYRELQHGGDYKDLEFQICRMDICHYAFPSNFERVIKGIGEMRAVENFEGCGSYNRDIQGCIEKELLALNEQFKSLLETARTDRTYQIRAWLTACLIKTLKEQVDLSEPVLDIEN